jgi:hypothetical protein
MRNITVIPPRVYIFSIGAIVLVTLIGLAIYVNGDVRANVKMFGFEFSIDTRARASGQTH